MSDIDKAEISRQLKELGLEKGSSVLVHSSMSSMGHVVGGADTVIDALLEVVAPNGNVLVPTLTGAETDSPANPPVFDPELTPTWTGRIPEVFRKRPDSIRSPHPTHSVAAIGPGANYFIEDHADSITPCDERSPYARLASLQSGYILLLGVRQESNTTFHHVEELAGVDYHMQRDLTKVSFKTAGRRVQRHYLLHRWGTPRNFEIMDELFIERGAQWTGSVGSATVCLIHASEMVAITLQALRADSRILCRK